MEFVLCSDSPACCELIQKTVQERRKERGQDQSQDPYGFGVYLWRAGNDYEAGEPDNARYSTHSKSNKHADDNLPHDIPSLPCEPSKARAAPLTCVTRISTTSAKQDSFTSYFIPGVQTSI